MKYALAAIGLALSSLCFGQDAAGNPPINPDRPDVTNGTGVTPVGRIVLELGYRQTHAGDGSLQEWGDGPTWRYGLNSRLELRLVSPTYAVDSSGGPGWEDANVGFKWLLRDGGSGFSHPGYAVQGGLSLPAGSRFYRSRVLLPGVTGIADFDLGASGDLGVNVGAGSQIGGNGRPFTLLSASLSYNHSLGGPWAAYAETYMLAPAGTGNGAAGHFADAGFQFLLSNDCMLDASGGSEFDRHRQSAYFDLGVSVRF